MGNRSTFILNTPEEDEKLLKQQQPTGNRDLWRTDNERKVAALRQRSDDAYNYGMNELASAQEFGKDLFRNAAGLPEAAGTVLSGLFSQTGTGLGTGAGIVADVVRHGPQLSVDEGGLRVGIKKPDWDAAAETTNENVERFTMQPKTEGGKQAVRGLGEVMAPIDTAINAVADPIAETYGPAAGAITKAGLNLVGGPEEAAAIGGALKGNRLLQQVLREAGPSSGVPSAGRMGRQRGAWTPGDIENVEGDFSLRSGTVDAFSRLKKQEQTKLPGRQLEKALIREGAKKEEMRAMGLDQVLDTDEVLSVADVRQLAQANLPKIEFSQTRMGPKVPPSEQDILDAIDSYARGSGDLRYPQVMYSSAGGYRRNALGHYNTADEAEAFLKEKQAEYAAQRKQEYLDTASNHLTEEELAEMSTDELDDWATTRANDDAVDHMNNNYYYESDYNADPLNLEEVRAQYDTRVRARPGDYGLRARSARPNPEHSEYTVGYGGREDEANYTVGFARSLNHPATGRGMDTPDFLRPYMQPATPDPSGQMPLLPEQTAQSNAFKREALRRQQIEADPNAAMYQNAQGYQPGVHYPAGAHGDRQIAFARETDAYAPDWGTAQASVGRVSDAPNLRLSSDQGAAEPLPHATRLDRPVHRVEEIQSDVYQMGRKRGMADPKGVVERQKVIEKIKTKNVDTQQKTLELLEKTFADPEVQKSLADYNSSRSFPLLGGFESYAPGGSRAAGAAPEALAKLRAGAGVEALKQLRRHVLPGDPGYDLVSQAHKSLSAMGDEIPEVKVSGYTGRSDDKGLVMSGPFSETEQYTKLMLADALRRAVQEGKQYFEWTEPAVHSARWGTETLQFAPTEGNPRKFLMTTTQPTAPARKAMTETLGENLQQRADKLLDPDAKQNVSDVTELDLDDPNIDQTLIQLVKSELSHGAYEYPSNQLFFEERAAAIKKQLEMLAKQAQAGERKAEHYSPRERGFNLAYGPYQKHIEQVLRAGGAKLPPVKQRGDLPSKRTSLFEIDPEIARAAKRGFKYPY